MPRWSNDDPSQGSAFHELVVLPTLAPHLSRPYHVPGTAEVIDTRSSHASAEQAASDLQASPLEDGGDTGAVNSPSIEELVVQQDFFMLVTLEWTERVKTVRSSRPKKMTESKNTSSTVKILNLTRRQFVTAALTAHGYQNAYVAGENCGPGMQVSWAGSAGGKKQVPVIQDDSDFHMMQVQLREQVRRTKGKLNTVCVTFNLDMMDGFKNHKRPLSPSASGLRHESDHTEMSRGTHVPSMDTFSDDQIALGRAIDDIKACWSCQKHGVCFVSSTGTHVELNRFRLAAFGSAIVAGHCEVTKGPPPELLQTWAPEISASASAAKIPRGRSGPGKVIGTVATPSSSSDTATLLLSTVVPMVTMMAQQTMSTAMKRSRRRAYSPPSSLPPSSPPIASSPPPPSSPPPALEDELALFLEAFGQSKGISEETIRSACLELKLQHYSPDSLSEASLSVERIQELTGLREGEVYSLRHFARKWCGKIDAKRAKHAHDST